MALALVLAAGAPDRLRAEEVTVFAAASLADAMVEIEERFEAASGHDLVVSLAGSSALARQIAQGAPADVVISASTDWMDWLVAAGTDAAPVAIGPGLDLAGMLGDGPLAMALVEAVPAGIYGKAALESLGLWDDVSGKVAQADNVRAALAFVATGEAPLGIVYGTDATAEGRVTVVGTFPADTHPPIVYPVAAVAGRESAAVSGFLDHLRGPEARRAFERQGFAVGAD
jgi:molybdate transport system substrate-binding protein